MKATELRIGNYVMSGLNTVFKIRYSVSEYNTDSYKASTLKPIPLTPEILEKAGFTFSKDKAHFTDGFHYYDFAFDGEKLTYLSPNSDIRIGHYCKYLHQLQNLYFALTGEELNIDL